jgi:hypothetical protein
MLNEQQEQHIIIPHIRTFKIENKPRIKISSFDEKSKLKINRLFIIPIESNVSPQEIFQNENKIQVIESLDDQNLLPKQEIEFINIPSTSDETILNREILQKSTRASSSKIQQIMNTIDHREVVRRILII